MAKVDDDGRFAAALRPFWDGRHPFLNREVALRWLNRIVGELLVDLLRREGLHSMADELLTLGAIDSIETAAATSRALFDVAVEIDRERAVARSVDAAIMVLAARNAVEAFLRPGPEREALQTICLRLRQLARATRRLEEESRRMFSDLADA